MPCNVTSNLAFKIVCFYDYYLLNIFIPLTSVHEAIWSILAVEELFFAHAQYKASLLSHPLRRAERQQLLLLCCDLYPSLV